MSKSFTGIDGMGLLSIVAVALLLITPIGVGFADTSYTATTTSIGNEIEANYGILSITCGGAQHPLESALKSSFSTVGNTDVEITRLGASSWTMPDTVSVQFKYSNIELNSSSSNIEVGIKIADLDEVKGSVSNGSVTLSRTLTKAEMEAIGVYEAKCILPCVTTIYNNANSSRTLDSDANVRVSVGSGTFTSSMPLSGITAIAANSTETASGTVTWFCDSSNVNYDNHNVRYEHVGSDTGTVNISFQISNITGLDGATFKIYLGGVNRGSAVMSNGTATITVNNLALTDDVYEQTLKIMVNHSSAVIIGVYNVTITASFNSYTAMNHGEVSTVVDTVDEVINAIIDANGGEGSGGTIEIGDKQAAVTESENDYGDGTVAVDISYTGSSSSSTGHGISNGGKVSLSNLGTNLGDSKFIIVLTLYKYGNTATVKATSGDVSKSSSVNGTSQVVICFANSSGTNFTIYEYDGNTSNLPQDSNSRYWMDSNSISISVSAGGGGGGGGGGGPSQGVSYVDMDVVVKTQ